MVRLNSNFAKVASRYLFSDIERKVALVKEKNSQTAIINLGLVDITKPLSPTLLATLCNASHEMGDYHTFHGYGPAQGYPFLREAIAYGEYRNLGISSDEIFISNGAKSDLSQIQELFAIENKIALCNPTYPLYIDSIVLAGRSQNINEYGEYEGIYYVPCLEENNFLPLPPSVPCDLIYLCSPNNPTGTAMDRRTLREWVHYALEYQSVIIFDGAYEAYISSDEYPHSIYEIDGAKEVAIEIRSFSKTAGFTGLRCSYSVVPKEMTAYLDGKDISIHSLWRRRNDTKFGGVPYPIQKCAAALYSPQGRKEAQEILQIYKDRAKFFLEGLQKLGFTVYGGINAPYIWCKTPNDLSSWEFFDFLLEELQIVTIPGRGFGRLGEGFVRFAAFAEPLHLAECLLRMKKAIPSMALR